MSISKRVVFIHTVPVLIEVFARLAANLLPGVTVLHVLDEPLLKHVRQQGGIGSVDVQRLESHVRKAESIGADAVLVTCSTISPAVDQVRERAPIPVLKIDEAMIVQAVGLGKRIGLVATNQTTLSPTRRLLEAEAKRASRQIEVTECLVDDALASLLAGDAEEHDRLVLLAVGKLASQVDVVLLAQATMARVLPRLKAEQLAVPVLASPNLALSQLASLLKVTMAEPG